MGKIDGENVKRVKKIVSQHGWLKISDYGNYTARNIWLLVQHMDSDVRFQEEILVKMERLLPDEVLKPDYALLYDRVHVNKGELQKYGSQGSCINGRWKPKPMIDPSLVDQRRAEMDLSTMKEYEDLMNGFCN